MDRPLILAVDGDRTGLELVGAELRRRYGRDYAVVCRRTGRGALQVLGRVRKADGSVALVLAGAHLRDVPAAGFFREIRRVEPRAKRVVLADRADDSAVHAAVAGSAVGQVDSMLSKPCGLQPDERFHRQVGELLYDWARANHRGWETVRIVGRRWSRRAHEMRDALGRNSVQFGYYDIDSAEGRALLAERGIDAATRLPVVIVRGGPVLVDPSNREVATALGYVGPPPERVVDLLVIGAGPAGLGAAVYGASEGLDTLVIEREALGGQAGQASLVSNYMGFPGGISGQELVLRACEQALLFGAKFLATRDTVALREQDGVYAVDLDEGGVVRARSVVVATGASYRTLGVPRLERLHGAGVFYGSVTSEARTLEGCDVFVAGAGNSAGQAALHLSRYARSVTVVSRRDGLAATMSAYLITRLRGADNVAVRLNSRIVDGAGDERLKSLVFEDARDGRRERVPAETLFVLIGAVPHTGWLPPVIARDQGGYLLTGSDITSRSFNELWPLGRAPFPLETSSPGVFAAGDVRHGALQRVVSAASDGALAVRGAYEFVAHEQPQREPQRARVA